MAQLKLAPTTLHAGELKINADGKLPSLTKNFAWTFVGNLVYVGCQWGMLVFLAKLGNVEMVGQFALGLALTAPVIMFANLQLGTVQATDARYEYRFGDYLALRLVTTALALVIIAGLVLLAGYSGTTALVVLLIGVAKGVEALSDVIYGLFQQQERMDWIATSMIAKGLISLLVLGAGVYVTGGIIGGIIGLMISWSLVLVGYDLRKCSYILKSMGVRAGNGEEIRPLLGAMHSSRSWPFWNARILFNLARLAFPLGVVMMLISLNANIPRYFIERSLGEGQLGVFAAMAHLMVAGNTIVMALGRSATPRLSQYHAAGDELAFRSLLFKLVAIGVTAGVVVTLVVSVAGRQVLTLIYAPEYAQQVDAFVWLGAAAGIGFVASFIGYGMTAARCFGPQAPLFTAVAIIAAVACAVLIPRNGLTGAAEATFLALAVQLIGSTVLVLRATHPGSGEAQP